MKKYDNFIYLLKIDTPDKRLYKIGSTKGSVHNRIKSLQTGCPYEIQLIEKYETIFGQVVERTLHNRYVSDKTHGEWFYLNLSEEVNFLENCKKIEELNINLEKNKEM